MTKLTPAQAMAELSVSRRWLLHLIASGTLPARLDAAAVARYRAKHPNRGNADRIALRARMRRGDS